MSEDGGESAAGGKAVIDNAPCLLLTGCWRL